MRFRHLCWTIACLLVLVAAEGSSQANYASATLEPHLGYGTNMRDLARADQLMGPLGFTWIRLMEEYDSPPSERLPYNILFTVNCEGFIVEPEGWEAHISSLANSGKGFVEAYEICNEPNLNIFWDHQPPDPADYVNMLCTAYETIKAIDPAATVVSAGLAPTGRIQGTCNDWEGNNCAAMDEQIFTREMLRNGAGECLDVLAYHPYGFAYPPETDPATVENGFTFRGAEAIRQIMVEEGLENTPMWATEYGWVRHPSEDGAAQCFYDPMFGGFHWMVVSSTDQASYLVRSFQYADQNWPWMHAMFVWNMDWYDYEWQCNASRFFALRQNDGTYLGAPTLAYNALAAMEKHHGSFGPRIEVNPGALTFMADVDVPRVITTTTLIHNSGYQFFTWTATLDSTGFLTPTLPITAGIQEEFLPLRMDTTGLVTGTYSGAITVTATASGTTVLNSPHRIELYLHIVPEMHQLLLPCILRRG